MWPRNEFNDFLFQQIKLYLVFQFYIRLKMQEANSTKICKTFCYNNFIKVFVSFLLFFLHTYVFTHLGY